MLLGSKVINAIFEIFFKCHYNPSLKCKTQGKYVYQARIELSPTFRQS